MHRTLKLILGAAFLIIFAFVFGRLTDVRRQYHYCYEGGRIWVESYSTFLAPYEYASDGAKLRHGHWRGWTGLGIQVEFDIPKSADPLEWKPSREAVLEKLKTYEVQHKFSMDGYDRNSYATNFISIRERYGSNAN